MAGVLSALGGGAAVAVTITAIDKFSNVFNTLDKKLIAAGAAFTALGIAATTALASTVQPAIDLAEETSKLSTVFDDIPADQLAMDITSLGEAYILSDLETTRLIASTGDLLTGLGLTDEAALSLSKDVLGLGSDLASFNNFQGGAAGAAKIVEKALLGERESLKSLGISILESDVKNQLLIDGTSELTGVALKEARARATMTLIMEQSGNAMGDVARTADSLANRQRELDRQTMNLKTSVGEALLPVVEALTNAMISVVGWFNNLSPQMKKTITILIIISISLIGILSFSIFRQSFTGSAINDFTHTKAICNEENFCQDYIITCKGEEILDVSPITGASVQRETDDVRPEDQRNFEGLCNISG